jgi:sodium transport system permease protein
MMRNIWLVYRKELLDTVRDRRTILSMIIIPILIFPILTIGFSTLLISLMEKSRAEIQEVAIVNGPAAPTLAAAIAASGEVRVVETDSVERSILDRTILAAVVIPDNFERAIEEAGTASLEILFDESRTESEFARQKLRGILADYRDSVITSRLRGQGLDESFVDPFTVTARNLASEQKMGSARLAYFLPYILLILSLTGAMYTAMDITAGEKERGTLETILVSPIPRWQLATGKLATILTTSFVSTLLALISMTATMAYVTAGAGSTGGGFGLQIAPVTIVVTLLMMIPTAVMFSAILMSLSLAAKTYKEAQSYVTPFMMVVIMPALVSFLPGIELGVGLSFVPLINVSLCIKEAMMGNINWLYVSLIFFSSLVYAAFAIFVAHRLFEKESVLFGD